MMFKLRDYQNEAIDATTDEWSRVDRTMVVLPTGMGKTVTFGEMINRLVREKHRCLMAVHRDELIKQAKQKLHSLNPDLTIGVVKGDRSEWDGRDVTLASIATLGRDNRLERIPPDYFDRIVVDECHHASGGMYLNALEHFGAFRPDSGTKMVGFTATPDRNDKGKFQVTLPTSGEQADVFESVAYFKDLTYGMENGYLIPDVKIIEVQIDGLDLAAMARKKADVQAETLGEALESSGALPRAAEAYAEHCRKPDGSLRKGIAFWPTVATARRFTEAANAAGIPCECVVGETGEDEREGIYARIRSGETILISNCGVLTEGFDQPDLEVALIGRLTKSQLLYLQMIGRVFRPWPGKDAAYIMDLTGCTNSLDIMCAPNLFGGDHLEPGEVELRESSGEAPVQKQLHSRVLTGEIHIRVRSLVEKSASSWLTTNQGKMFIPTSHGYLFIKEDPDNPGMWMVGKTAGEWKRKGPATLRLKPEKRVPVANPGQWGWAGRDLTLEHAMMYAEQLAGYLDPTIASKKSSWKRKCIKPTDAQMNLATRMGITVPEGASRGDVGILITVKSASTVLDI